MRGSSASTSGISDMPVRLIMAAVITSIALPVIWGAYSDLSTTMTVSGIEHEIGELLLSIEEVVNGGVGSTIEIDLEFRSWGLCNIDKVTIGGDLNDTGPDRYLARYSIDGGRGSFLSLDPPLAMTLASGEGSLELSEGSHRIRLVHGQVGIEHVAYLEKVG
ncbi:MAG: hypothetical protein ACMUHB_05340 [Thermoplasmatota archaeon]